MARVRNRAVIRHPELREETRAVLETLKDEVALGSQDPERSWGSSLDYVIEAFLEGSVDSSSAKELVGVVAFDEQEAVALCALYYSLLLIALRVGFEAPASRFLTDSLWPVVRVLSVALEQEMARHPDSFLGHDVERRSTWRVGRKQGDDKAEE